MLYDQVIFIIILLSHFENLQRQHSVIDSLHFKLQR